MNKRLFNIEPLIVKKHGVIVKNLSLTLALPVTITGTIMCLSFLPATICYDLGRNATVRTRFASRHIRKDINLHLLKLYPKHL